MAVALQTYKMQKVTDTLGDLADMYTIKSHTSLHITVCSYPVCWEVIEEEKKKNKAIKCLVVVVIPRRSSFI